MARPADDAYPLYDARFEHDACGVGFVADAGGSRRRDVLPLALSGLAALGHRGAFAADGESSDGAGVALPLEPGLLRRIAPGVRGRPAVAMLFLPRAPSEGSAAQDLVVRALEGERLELTAWREVPLDVSAVGSQARDSLPRIAQAVVRPPAGATRPGFERALLLARRRMELDARGAGIAEFAVASASTRTVVYKGLVAGDALARLYPDLRCGPGDEPLPLSHAVFHQRYATNTSPRWPLAQPLRLISHNGEINTVRGNREQLRGRAANLGGSFGRRLAALGPLLTSDGSDSVSLDEALDLLTAAGWPLEAALLALIPEALPLRLDAHDDLADFQRRTAGMLAPWDGPAALVFSDGRRVGMVLDRNGLRPAACTITEDGLVAVASEAGAIPIDAARTVERRRLGPGEMLLVDPIGGEILGDAEAKRAALRRFDAGMGRRPRARRSASGMSPSGHRHSHRDVPANVAPTKTSPIGRWLAGLDAEKLRLDIKTMALEGREPLWSMGDDTPTPALGRLDRPVVDHLRQSFAQVTNPAIDPERERVVMDLSVELGRRPALLAPLPASPASLRLPSPFVSDLDGLQRAFVAPPGGPRRRLRTLDATWRAGDGPAGLGAALDRMASEAVGAARRGAELLVLSDRGCGEPCIAIPSALAVGAVHTALTESGLRGATDLLVDAADILDVHAAAMALAAGAGAVCPRLAVELAAELAGSRGAETVSRADAIANLLGALDRGLRKILARMGISTVASYIGGQFFEILELDREVAERCFPAAPIWPGTVGLQEIAQRQRRRLATGRALPAGDRLPDPGFVRFRGDGELHLYAPVVVKAIQSLAETGAQPPAGEVPASLDAYRSVLDRQPAVVRDQLALRRVGAVSVPLDEVEPVDAILRRFVGSAMSLGALSPEAHQTLTIGLRRIGAASNSGEGGEDPAWYVDDGGPRRDTAIKQVASARFGVTATYLSRAEQLEIKISQGSKPGEGGQLPGRKATALIASLRRGQPGISMISPPPHHDIYSIEDLAQLIADLRAINPGARIGVKLVAALGIGTIAAGVAKAGADYVQVSGHAGGTGASPLSSIKHAGIPWELGLAETHQVLMRNGLRDRIAVRTDGGLQTGRDVLVAALLGAEEFGFGTASLVALGCDMARQCHLDTCPTGIATQREDLRAKFVGTPEAVERFFRAIAEDVRRELAGAGLRSVGEAIGATDLLRPAAAATLDLSRLLEAPAWAADPARRADPAASRALVARGRASPIESELAARFVRLPAVRTPPAPPRIERGDCPPTDGPHDAAVGITTAERAFGAHVSGLIERGLVRRPVRWLLEGSAGQSFGAFAGSQVELTLVGQANDYVGKGLSGGVVVLRPEPELEQKASLLAIAGNTCLYGATSGRVHLVGRAGMRFAVRNSGAEAVVEGIGAHGCEYMTGGVVVILGAAGRNLGAGMSGGRIYLHDPDGSRVRAIDATSVHATRLSAAAVDREDGGERVAEVRRLLVEHRDAGSRLARSLLASPGRLGDEMWLIESTETAEPSYAIPEPSAGRTAVPRAIAEAPAGVGGNAR